MVLEQSVSSKVTFDVILTMWADINLWETPVVKGFHIKEILSAVRCVHTSTVGHRLTSADIVARVETMSTFVR